MKRSKLVGTLALALGIGLGAVAPRIAGVARGGDLSSVGQQLEGTWITTVSRESGTPGLPLVFTSLNTFLPGGALLETTAASMTRSPGHGQWLRTGDRQFTTTFVFFRFDAMGAFIGTQRVTRNIRLNERLDEYRAVNFVEIFDAAGTLTMTDRATETAMRLRLGELAMQPEQP